MTKNKVVGFVLTEAEFDAPEFADPVVWRVWVWCRVRCALGVVPGSFDIDVHLPKLGSCLSVEAALTKLADSGRIVLTKDGGRCYCSLPKAKAAAKKPRAKVFRDRDELFDAIVQATGSDPVISGSQIAAACKTLRSCAPPYTPTEVDEFAANIRRHCPWTKLDIGDGLHRKPTIGEVLKYVARVRHAESATPLAKPAAMTKASLAQSGLI